MHEALQDTRVVLINGARQCGKSTLAQLVGAAHGAEWRTLIGLSLGKPPRRTTQGNGKVSAPVHDVRQMEPHRCSDALTDRQMDPIRGRRALTSAIWIQVVGRCAPP